MDYMSRVIIAFLLVSFFMSLVTFVFFAKDKANAGDGGYYRIPERTLLFLCMLGGWGGGLFAMLLLRHKSNKSRKNYFRVALYISAILWALTLLFLVIYKFAGPKS